ncbi:MAG: membrane integrity-associated transporter subunit PqiC [Alphaproteobacteria bacterium]|nr:membrane integrity-associated transporter subunit PqiC [Alphaproteobacteria bacterium]MBF0128981.1 membrane integrity-associated transporter subunit PqiC [Alphaproteobacteria bacterium]
MFTSHFRPKPLALVLGLAACAPASSVPPESFYRIDVPAPQEAAARRLPGVVEVAPLDADGVIGERAIVHTDDSGVLLKYSYHSWIETPAEMLHKELVNYLRRRGVAEQVAGPELRLVPTHRVQGALRRLEQVTRPDGSALAVVDMELALIRGRDPKPLILKTYHAERAARDPSVLEATRAIREAVAEVFSRFADDMGKN